MPSSCAFWERSLSKMNWFIILGIVLGALTIVTDRYIHKLPNWLAIILFVIAWILIIVGMILTRIHTNQ